MSWPELLTRLLGGQDLSAPDVAWAMDQVMSGEAEPAQLAAFLTALRAKGETVEEMRGLADEMLAHAHRFEVSGSALDIVGTGGDRAHTVNISTMSCVVAAAAGVPVVKHGNRAASSRSGAADLLETLGVRLDLTPEQVASVGTRVGITFCFAQAFHPSMRHAAPVRRDLGIPTAFNFLGPLTNPAQPSYAAVGVADARMAPLLAGVFAERGGRAAIFRGDDGLDEVTPATTSTIWWVADGGVTELTLDPVRLGLGPHAVADLVGADADFNAAVARDIFAGAGGAVRDAVLLNAGLALAVVADGEADSALAPPRSAQELHERVEAGAAQAASAIDSGAARDKLAAWVEATQTAVTP
ncbi:MAG: anthranilate phosphoribosyltransferase [Ornithinimicrobium sp.]|uniref:anthranilate phosphoribosyltransferase n=1 Tax=Ornithinimicrobium sp. TaxID=1977084 RepID=UPI003D9AB8A8